MNAAISDTFECTDGKPGKKFILTNYSDFFISSKNLLKFWETF